MVFPSSFDTCVFPLSSFVHICNVLMFVWVWVCVAVHVCVCFPVCMLRHTLGILICPMCLTGSPPELSEAEWPVSSNDLHDTMFPMWGYGCTPLNIALWLLFVCGCWGKDACVTSALLTDQSLQSPQNLNFYLRF